MEIPSLADLKRELSTKTEKELVKLLSDLANFNRDNKSFLYFKMYENESPGLFLSLVQEEIDQAFAMSSSSNYHLAKKSAQSIRKKLNKNLKLTKNKADQAEAILYFCEHLKKYGYLDFRHPVIDNLYRMQLGKAQKLISSLHEDLQSDFNYRIEELNL